MAHNSVRPGAAASPPTPPHMEYETGWPSRTPTGDRVTTELWSDRRTRTAQVRVLRGPVLGVLADQETSAGLTAEPDPEAVDRYGADWVAQELTSAERSLTIRWGATAFMRGRRR